METRDFAPDIVLPPGTTELLPTDSHSGWRVSADGCIVHPSSFSGSVAAGADGSKLLPYSPASFSEADPAAGRLPVIGRRGTVDKMPNIPFLGKVSEESEFSAPAAGQLQEPVVGSQPLQPYLVVNLWKERLELEVSLKREGLRFLFTLLFGILFSYSQVLLTKPADQFVASTLINSQMGLASSTVVPHQSVEGAFESLMSISTKSRGLFPFSSDYVEQGLEQAFLTNSKTFSNGPELLIDSAQPKLPLRWGMYFWVSLPPTDDIKPKMRALIQQRTTHLGSDLTCWALFSQGKRQYTLMYGEHNIPGGAQEISFDFGNVEGESILAETTTMVALSLNSTHAVMTLQGGGGESVTASGAIYRLPAVVTRRLPPELLPSECPDGKTYLGDVGVTLATAAYVPKMLTPEMFKDIEEVGQPLLELAAGLRGAMVVPDVESTDPAEMEAHQVTQEMVTGRTATLESLVRLTGAVAFEGALAIRETAEAGDAEFLAGAVNGTNETLFIVHGDLSTGKYYPLASEPFRLGELLPGVPDALSQNLTAAVAAIGSARQADFTLTWWAREGLVYAVPPAAEDTRLKLVLAESGVDIPLLQLSYLRGGDLPAAGGWEFRLNGAPECTENDALCMASPAFWCQAPDTGTYDGIWRHFALRSGLSSITGGREMQMYQDGVPLCGLTFSADEQFVPHFPRSEGGEVVATLSDQGTERLPEEKVEVRDLRVYASALSSDQVTQLANISSAECTSINSLTDNGTYRTPFGQSCQNLARLVALGTRRSLSACELPEAKEQCPIACLRVGTSACFDGIVTAAPLGGSPFGTSTKTLLANEDVLAARYPDTVSHAAASQAASKFAWLSGDTKIWHDLFPAVERMPYAAVLMAESLPVNKYVSGLWSEDSTGDCPGDSLQNALLSSLCEVADMHQTNMADAIRNGIDPSLYNFASGFDLGLLQSGTSFTIYFWAKALSMNGIRLAGIDGDNNICFAIDQEQTTLMRRDALRNNTGSPLSARQTLKTIDLRSEDDDDGSYSSADEWAFFAMSLDLELGKLSILAEGNSVEQELEDGESWGCNGLQYVLNLGGELMLSPIRVLKSPLPSGVLQHLMMRQRAEYNGLPGPRSTRAQRLVPRTRERRMFTQKVVGISPPLLLQSRDPARSQAVLEQCKQDVVLGAMEERLEDTRDSACEKPYQCDWTEDEIVFDECSPGGGSPAWKDGRFFGRQSYQYEGQSFFPDFAWALDNKMVVRGGQLLTPATQYLDTETSDVRLLMTLYGVDSKVAGVLEVKLDFSKRPIQQKFSLRQVKVFNSAQLNQWLVVTASTTFVAMVCFLLSLPAAIQELLANLRQWKREFRHQASRFSTMNAPVPMEKPRAYSSDTTQPDVMDAIGFTAVSVYLIQEMIRRGSQNTSLRSIFTNLAGLEWGNGDVSFNDKMDDFLNNVTEAQGLMQEEKRRNLITFCVLLLCALRLILFMRMHPHLGTITSTFGTVGVQLLNFLCSFGTIFIFMAVTAHVQFGSYVEKYSTIPKALLAQFVVLLTVDLPDFGSDVFMSIYVVGYVLLCVMFMLNFFLAIIVEGYTKALGNALESIVARPVTVDTWCVMRDSWRWWRQGNTWPSKIRILNILQQHYPDVFMNGFQQADGHVREKLISRQALRDMFAGSRVREGSMRYMGSSARGSLEKGLRRVSTFRKRNDSELRDAADAVFDLYSEGFRGKMLLAHI